MPKRDRTKQFLKVRYGLHVSNVFLKELNIRVYIVLEKISFV